MGAEVAAVAALHMRRIRDVLDAYRVSATATAQSAKNPQELGLDEHDREIGDLRRAGVLKDGAHAGAYFLDEKSYIIYRDHSRRRKKVAILLVGALFLIFMVFFSGLM